MTLTVRPALYRRQIFVPPNRQSYYRLRSGSRLWVLGSGFAFLVLGSGFGAAEPEPLRSRGCGRAVALRPAWRD